MSALDPMDRKLIERTQAGMPLSPRPYAKIAEQLTCSENEVIKRLSRLMDRGIVRKIALAPNHFALGLTANGMTVWDVDDAKVSELGNAVGQLPFVTHCYRRPRILPVWPYNLFAMVHGTTRDEVEAKREEIAKLLGSASRASDILYSQRILKKTGLRLTGSGG